MERIGLQLYTVRDLLAADFDATLARVAAIGYTDVETAGYHGRTPDEMAAALQQYRLRAPSAHVEYTTDDRLWARTLDDAVRAGHAWVVVPWLPDDARDSHDAWRRTADRLNRMGDAARAHGLRFAYHNHDFEFVPAGGDVPYDLLLAGTDPALVAFELDVYWMTKAGRDPVAYLDRHPQRFTMTHLKDSAGAPSHRMTEVGSGTIDFARVLAACERAGVAHHFVEHDQPADALQSIEASYRWLRALEY